MTAICLQNMLLPYPPEWVLGRDVPNIYRPTPSIHFFSMNTIDAGTYNWHNYADTWLGVDAWPVRQTYTN